MRKNKFVSISGSYSDDIGNRDNGKRFMITEMPAMQAEKWAARAFMVLARSGTELPDGVESSGLAGIAVLGFKALGNANFKEVEPLLDEMMRCVKIVPDPNQPAFVRDLVGDDDIEEIATIALLRAEVFELHTGFSLRDALLRSLAARNEETSENTLISQP